MSAFKQAAIDELYGVVSTALSLPSTSPNWRSLRAATIDWRGLIEDWEQAGSGHLNPPYVVMQLGMERINEEFSPIDGFAYDLPWWIHYIDRKADVTLEAFETKLETLRDALMPGISFTSFQVLYPSETDYTEENPINQVMLE
ncbi:MAG TPA: hypothetical protein VJQ25_03955, partial [Nitrospira sp.]|nr:hypothetical protein [Nitrospira sp.]